jgi:hypothetical protein
MAQINEVELVCIKLPADVSPTSSADDPRFLSILLDEGQPPRPFGAGLPFLPRYETIGRVCTQRATLAVDGSLRVRGRCIEPDAYIRRWRQALADACSLEQLRDRIGLQLVADIDFEPTRDVLTAKPRWINAPYPTPAALAQAHGEHVQPRAAGSRRFRMSIDLATPHGARDAWWLDDWVDPSHGASRLVIIRAARPGSAQRQGVLA